MENATEKTRAYLEKKFFEESPRSQKIDPLFQAQFDMLYKAHLAALKQGTHVLNIFSAEDLSDIREKAYHDIFFRNSEYEKIHFWKDSFVHPKISAEQPHKLPYADGTFDVVVTTKIILEHSSEPGTVVKEFFRVLKPGGKAFIIAPFFRRQHQKPFDFFRFTEDGLRHLLIKKAGFKSLELTPGGGAISALAHNLYFVQRSLNLPKPVEKVCDVVHRSIVEPALFYLDRFDNGYGRDLTRAFYVVAQK